MPLPPTAEIICSFSTLKTEPLSPFVWLLLNVLSRFREEERPDFQSLSRKLAFEDPRYLELAWGELSQFKLCESGNSQAGPRSLTQRLMFGDSIDYESARLTQAGRTALEDGFIRTGEARRRKGEALYFIIRDGSPVTRWSSEYASKEVGPLHRPEWANKLTEATIAKALKEQRVSPDEHIEPDEQVFDLEIHWEESRRVKLD